MKKYFKYYGICWAIALVVFSVITFVTANETVGLALLVYHFGLAIRSSQLHLSVI